MKRTAPTSHKPSRAAVTLTSFFLAAATLSGCGGGDSTSSAPSSSDNAPAPLLDGTTADPNPPVQEDNNPAPAPAAALPTPVTDAPAQPPASLQLADNLTEGVAAGSMWRTSALWGIGYTELVAGKDIKVGYLHDSRARTLTEAIMWHGGEGTASRQRFEALSKADRDALMAFLRSL